MDKEQVIKLINDTAQNINSNYPNTIPDERKELIINHYLSSNKPIELIQQELSTYFKDYTTPVITPVNNKVSFDSIKSAYDTLNSITKFNNYKTYLDMEIAPFFIAKKPLNRTYDGLDMLIDLKDLEEFRSKIKNTPYYQGEFDTKNIVKDGNDYGLSIYIDNVKVNVSPFIKDKDSITRFKYVDNKYIVEDIKDKNYLKTYKVDGKDFNTVSLEAIKRASVAKQDPEVSTLIDQIGYNEEEYNKEVPTKIIKEVDANSINNTTSNEIVKNSLVKFLYDVKKNDNKDIPDEKLNEAIERLHNKPYDVVESYLTRAKDRINNPIEVPKALNNQEIERPRTLGFSTTRNIAYTIIFVGIIICLLSVVIKVI